MKKRDHNKVGILRSIHTKREEEKENEQGRKDEENDRTSENKKKK